MGSRTIIAAGGWHSMAVQPDGSIVTWRWNANGALGNGTLINRPTIGPMLVTSSPLDIAASINWSLEMNEDGRIYVSGPAWFFQLGHPGTNWFGTLDGSSSNTVPQPFPLPVKHFRQPSAITSGPWHSMAVYKDRAYAWGSNGRGGLSDGTLTGRYRPRPVQRLGDVAKICCGMGFSFAILKDELRLAAWGANERGQLGDGTTADQLLPVSVTNLPQVTSVAAGVTHGIALDGNRSVWTWGGNFSGQLGDSTNANRNVPAMLAKPADIVAVAAGQSFSMALSHQGFVYSWGDNSHGQLGDGTQISRNSPVQVEDLREIVAIAAGAWHALALDRSGFVWAWGSNNVGQLGDGTNVSRFTPGQVIGLAGL